ncbi:MAG: hypothetical protein LBU32_29975 [Clostridiales bacterium]|jgi:hypothetical protein|nr:hypothetical protein [Clostridiales bacterium]
MFSGIDPGVLFLAVLGVIVAGLIAAVYPIYHLLLISFLSVSAESFFVKIE